MSNGRVVHFCDRRTRLRALRLADKLGERWYGDRGENPDDRDDDHQLDQRETSRTEIHKGASLGFESHESSPK
jgi:hypothetical protein